LVFLATANADSHLTRYPEHVRDPDSREHLSTFCAEVEGQRLVKRFTGREESCLCW
jgi:hypothetical protein